MKGLFVQHRSHTPAERRKSRMAKHLELIHPVSIDKGGKSEEIDPIFHRLVKGSQEPFLLIGSPFQKFSCLRFALVAEVTHQEIAHLPAVAHLFGIDPDDATEISFRRS